MPSDPVLSARVLDKLNKVAAGKDDAWKLLVLAALEGDQALADAIEAGAGPQKGKTATTTSKGKTKASKGPIAAEPQVAYLRSITVEGFRGVGKQVSLELPPGPGLTLVIGRNGSGKSSFAEGLELLLTGQTYRWLDRAKIWKDGWRNLHHPHASVQAEFSLQGEPKPCALVLAWKEGDPLEAGSRTAQIRGKARMDAAALGWDQRLAGRSAPMVEDVAGAPARLRKADEAQRKIAGPVASRGRQLADLLDKALAFHDTHGDGGCPVCDREGALSKPWHEKKKKEASAFREAATAATAAGSEAEAARKVALALAVPSPQAVERAASVGLDKLGAAALQGLADWQLVISAGAGAELSGLARNLEMASNGLRAKIEALRDAAAVELAKREDRWRPLAVQLASWVQVARDAVRGNAGIPAIKSAEKWLKDTAGELRDERFAPIADRAQAICDDLLKGSNVKVA